MRRQAVFMFALIVPVGLGSAVAACGDGGDDAPVDVQYLPVSDDAGDKADAAAGPQVELKVTLAGAQVASAVKKFKLKDDAATFREVTFYDDADLSLFDAGLVLRARKVKNGPDDSTVKLRPFAREDVDASWFGVSGFKCEEDRTGSKSVSSCSLTGRQDKGEIDDVASGERTLDKLFTSDQEDFLEGYAPAFEWDALEALGPTSTRVWSLNVSGFSTKLAFERWVLPDGTDLLEVSCRVDLAKGDKVQRELGKFLASKGFDVAETSETKTRVALDYYAGR